MADRTPSNSPLASDRLDQASNPYAGGQHHAWTKGGLPHDFKGWGPQTPDSAEEVRAVDIGLTWDGEDDHKHFVWRFDRRLHHH